MLLWLIFYANIYELEILGLLRLLAPNDPEIQDVAVKTFVGGGVK